MPNLRVLLIRAVPGSFLGSTSSRNATNSKAAGYSRNIGDSSTVQSRRSRIGITPDNAPWDGPGIMQSKNFEVEYSSGTPRSDGGDSLVELVSINPQKSVV